MSNVYLSTYSTNSSDHMAFVLAQQCFEVPEVVKAAIPEAVDIIVYDGPAVARRLLHLKEGEIHEWNVTNRFIGAYPEASQEDEDSVEEDIDVDAYYRDRREAGLRIDPATAEINCWYAYSFDPYGIDPYIPCELRDLLRRQLFARDKGSNGWVWFGHLPEATRGELSRKLKQQVAKENGVPAPARSGVGVIKIGFVR